MENRNRCSWCLSEPLYKKYHDEEWGVPERDPRALWENLILESFQSGLSWITILRKREGFRQAFAGFDPVAVASWGPEQVEILLKNDQIIRHRGKIEATISNAKAWCDIQEREGFSALVWGVVEDRPMNPKRQTMADVPAKTAQSDALTKLLKQRGFKFFGPTTAYAFMQASGLVNDHVTDCFRHTEVAPNTN